MEARLFSSYTVYEIEDVIHHKGIYISLEMQIRNEKNRTLSNSSAFGLPRAEKLELVLPTSLSESKLSQEVFSSFEMQMDRPPVSIHTHHLGLPPATAVHRLLELPIQMSSSSSKRITNKLSLIAYRA